MATKVDIGGRQYTLFLGENKRLEWNVTNEAGGAVDITTWTMKFVLRLTDAAADPPVLDKAVTADGAFSPTNNPQRAVCTLSDTETQALEAITYRYSVKRTNAGSETILAFGNFAPLRVTQLT